ncbi:hypothetical protein LINPERHAP2_LOCUS7082, partial [Linum perenne]
GWSLLQDPNNIWAKLLKGLYFPKPNFLKASKGSKISWIWANICDAREIL